MAIDIIIRPEGKCITLAFDVDLEPIAALSIRGTEVRIVFDDGKDMALGTLAESMRLDAKECSICVAVKLDGDRVEYSHTVYLLSD